MAKIFHHYDIAYRKRGGAFRVVPPPSYGWTADPFLVAYEGAVYLFAEIFLYKTERNGVIGCCRYDGDGFGPWMVTMDKHWHLSYPNVSVRDGRLYMVPESYQAEEIAEYVLAAWPDRWEKHRVFAMNREFCDTTFFTFCGQSYLFTFLRQQPSPHGEGWLYRVVDGKAVDGRKISDALYGARCGGKVFERDGKLIRVAQNAENGYGGSLIFFAIDSVAPEYREHVVGEWHVADVLPDGPGRYTGIHTYNALGNLEVIDLRYETTSPEEVAASRRAHEMFVDKYR